uniref:hypothetical protein n=1 Tax=Lachnoclostridium phocaeense TaxID=1871021 RepID=UPI0026DA9348|nr:hypothetical protein [Lachnoclostridium phocaeense]
MKKNNNLLSRMSMEQVSPAPRAQEQNGKVAESYYEPQDSSKWSEKDLELDEKLKEDTAALEQKRWKLSTRIINILLIAGCIYLVFLIYGVLVTEYQYDSSGEIYAQQMSVSDIRKKKNYETILVQYEQCRVLYERVLLLDYRMEAGQEEPMNLATEYEALLDEVEDLSIKTDALTVDSKYSQIRDMMVEWIRDDIAVYLQNMSASVSENDLETANKALQDKDRVYDNFSLITQNIVATGEQIRGIDLSDIRAWTPEEYIDQEINGN